MRLTRNGGASRKEPEVEDPVENETEEVRATAMKKLVINRRIGTVNSLCTRLSRHGSVAQDLNLTLLISDIKSN